MVSNDFINECKTPAYEDRLGKIVIDETEYNQSDYLTSFEIENNIYNNGTIIGNTYTKSLKFSLINVDKDTEFVTKKATPSVGVKYDDESTEYIEFDDYTLESLNDEQTKNFTDITGYDSLNKLDKPYVCGLSDGVHTIKEYWLDLLDNLGLETETNTFTNDDIEIPANPFVNNETNRIVLSEIEKVSCTYNKIEKRTRTVDEEVEIYHVINLMWFDENRESNVVVDENGYLDDVSRIKNIELYGSATGTQVLTTMGKNLAGIPEQSFTLRGVDVTIEGDEITINGTSTSNGNPYYLDPIDTTILKGNYTLNIIYLSGTYSGEGNINIRRADTKTYIQGVPFRETNNSNSISIQDNTSIMFGIYFNAGTSFANYKIKFQLVKSDASDYSYEPYKGKTYSIELGDLELDESDYIYKDCNKWYKYSGSTPTTTTEITDETLINQLNTIKLLNGINNISVSGEESVGNIKIMYYTNYPDYEFETNDYSTLNGSLTKYGPVNCVLLGYENIGGENVYRQDDESIEENGETKLLINAEYFLFTQALREQAIDAIYEKLSGFEYYDLSLTTYYGKPFLDIGDKIRVNTNEDNVYDTYILSHTFTYDGTFKSVIKSPALTKQEEIVKSTESISNKIKRTEIMVDKANGTITSLTQETSNIQTDLRENYYTINDTNLLVQSAKTGITNTFSEAGGNNIFRNTGLWFEATSTEATLFPSNSTYPSSETFTGNQVYYEFWNGKVEKIKEDRASNMTAMKLKNGDFYQEQIVPNGSYTVSFKYQKLIQLANVTVKINDVSYQLNNMEETEFVQTIQVNSQHIIIIFSIDIDNGCEIYDLMVNAGSVKLAYSQNQNETTTDTVNISKGITITSSDLDVTFKANADGIRTLDKNGNELTKFTDTGMTTKEAIIESKSQIVGTLWQEVGEQTWITRL